MINGFKLILIVLHVIKVEIKCKNQNSSDELKLCNKRVTSFQDHHKSIQIAGNDRCDVVG